MNDGLKILLIEDSPVYSQDKKIIKMQLNSQENKKLRSGKPSRTLHMIRDYQKSSGISPLLKNPFLGTGYSSIDIATDNDLLRSLGEVGILGTIGFVLILVEISKRIFKSLKNDSKLIRYFSAGTLSMLFAFIFNGLFIDVFEASKVASLFWMILGLNLAVRNFK